MNQSDHTGCGDSIGLDLGTTAMKGVRLTPAGKLAAACEVATSYNHPHPGFVEVDPAAHWLAVATLIRKLVAAAPGKVSAIAIAGAADTPFSTLSDGQQRLGLLARALYPQPRLLLLDEPCFNLDHNARRLVLQHLAEVLQHNPQMTAICVAHRSDDIPAGFNRCKRLAEC